MVLFAGLWLGASGIAGAQDVTGSIIISPYSGGGGNGAALGGVCVQLTGVDDIDETACSEVGQGVSNSAVFTGLPDGTYQVSLVSAPDGCSTNELPIALTVENGGEVQHNPAFDCGTSTMEVHLNRCADNVADLFSCHENRVEGGSIFILDSGYVTTDASGVASGELLAGETYISRVSPPADVLRVYAYCTDENDGTVLFDGVTADGVAQFVASGGATVVCDVYDIVAATVDPTPTATAAGTVTPAPTSTATVISLPNTGSGASEPAGSSNLFLAMVLSIVAIGGLAVVRIARVNSGK
jgi:hypothetical protein